MDEVELPAKDTQTRTLPPEYSDPERYRVLSNGAIYDMQIKRIVSTPGGGTTAITQASAGELRALWKAKKARSRLRGLVRGVMDANGKQVDVSDIDDELVVQASDALEAMTAHFVRTFMGSKNLRGMSEGFGKLADIDDNAPDSGPAQAAASAVADLAAAIRAIAERQERQAVGGTVIDG